MPVHFSPSRSLKYWRITLRTADDSSLSRVPVSARLSARCLGCKGDLFVIFVFQLPRAAHDLAKELVHGLELLLRGLEGIHARTEDRRAAQALGVPADVLARNPHAALAPVEAVELVQVLDGDIADLLRFGRRQLLAGGEEVGDLAEDPGAALGGAADHDRVRARVFEHEACFFRRGDVA